MLQRVHGAIPRRYFYLSRACRSSMTAAPAAAESGTQHINPTMMNNTQVSHNDSDTKCQASTADIITHDISTPALLKTATKNPVQAFDHLLHCPKRMKDKDTVNDIYNAFQKSNVFFNLNLDDQIILLSKLGDIEIKMRQKHEHFEIPKGQFVAFLDLLGDVIAESGRDMIRIPIILAQIHATIVIFSKVNFDIPEKMRVIYKYVEDLPLSSMNGEQAVDMAVCMLYRKRFSPKAIQNLLRISMQASEMSSEKVRQAKLIEMILQLDERELLSTLTTETTDYLTAVRNQPLALTSESVSLLDNKVLYQAASILKNFQFPNSCGLIGPYILRVCDSQNKVVFLTDDLFDADGGNSDCPFHTCMKRHLRMLGWQVLVIRTNYWESLVSFEMKANYLETLFASQGEC